MPLPASTSAESNARIGSRVAFARWMDCSRGTPSSVRAPRTEKVARAGDRRWCARTERRRWCGAGWHGQPREVTSVDTRHGQTEGVPVEHQVEQLAGCAGDTDGEREDQRAENREQETGDAPLGRLVAV